MPLPEGITATQHLRNKAIEGAQKNYGEITPVIQARLDHEFDVDIGVIINDSFGRPWRFGVVGVALGAAGLPAVRNMIGVPDLFGRKMRVTEVAVADEIQVRLEKPVTRRSLERALARAMSGRA